MGFLMLGYAITKFPVLILLPVTLAVWCLAIAEVEEV